MADRMIGQLELRKGYGAAARKAFDIFIHADDSVHDDDIGACLRSANAWLDRVDSGDGATYADMVEQDAGKDGFRVSSTVRPHSRRIDVYYSRP